MLNKFLLLIFLIIHLMTVSCTASLPEDIANSNDECLNNSLEALVLCRGSRAIRNALNNLSKSKEPVVIVRGLELVPSSAYSSQQQGNATDDDNFGGNKPNSSNVTDNDTADDTFLGRVSRYLRTHELNIKFSDLMADESERHYLARDLDQSGMQMNHLDVNEARKKDKGSGMMMLMALMFSKMMAVMGLGGLGALAMKALGISMLALMMAALVGMKSLANQGHESTHSVQYVQADGHHHKRRRRRSSGSSNKPYVVPDLLKNDIGYGLPLPYTAWAK